MISYKLIINHSSLLSSVAIKKNYIYAGRKINEPTYFSTKKY